MASITNDGGDVETIVSLPQLRDVFAADRQRDLADGVGPGRRAAWRLIVDLFGPDSPCGPVEAAGALRRQAEVGVPFAGVAADPGVSSAEYRSMLRWAAALIEDVAELDRERRIPPYSPGDPVRVTVLGRSGTELVPAIVRHVDPDPAGSAWWRVTYELDTGQTGMAGVGPSGEGERIAPMRSMLANRPS